MIDSLKNLETPWIVIFYLFLFSLIWAIKKQRQTKIVINTIWFSLDGSVSNDALENLLSLAKMIKTSRYQQNYALYFWTDTRKLNKQVKVKFKKSNIYIKDYREILTKDKMSIQTLQLVEGFLGLANENNKLFFAMASDVLRLYILLKLFPEKYNNHYTLYIDCNDIEMKTLASPDLFKELNFIAFRYATFRDKDFVIQLLKLKAETRVWINNDIILTKNKKHEFYDELMAVYLRNISNISKAYFDLFAMLAKTRHVLSTIDTQTTDVIVLGVTHLLNTLFIINDNLNETFLLSRDDKRAVIKNIPGVQDVDDFLDYDRNLDKAYTWGSSHWADNTNYEEVMCWRDYLLCSYQQKFKALQNFLS